MERVYHNIYRTARNAAGLTQEKAAELIGVSDSSIKAYETGQRIPPNDVVLRMVEYYNQQPLAVQHLRQTNVLAQRFLPELDQQDVLVAAVQLFNRMNQFQQHRSMDRLLAITEDSVIDDSERAEYDAIMAEIQSLIKSGMALTICGRE